MLEHDRIGGEQPPDLASVAFKSVTAFAGEVEDQPDMLFLTRRDLKHLVKGGDLVAGDVAIRPRHLGAERDRRDRKRNRPARVGVGRIVPMPMPVHDVIGGTIEQCPERAAKGQIERARHYSANKAHRFRILPLRDDRTRDPALRFPGSPILPPYATIRAAL